MKAGESSRLVNRKPVSNGEGSGASLKNDHLKVPEGPKSTRSFKGGFFTGIFVSAGFGLLVLLSFQSQWRFDSFLANVFKQSDAKVSLSPPPASQKKTVILLPQFKDQPDPGIQKTGSPNMDACRLLSKCFDSPDSMYKSMESCWQNIGMTLQYLDSAFMVERDEVTGHDDLVAFISIDRQKRRRPSDQMTKQQSEQADSDVGVMHAMFIYNVCVRPDRRGGGLGKRLVNEFVDQMVEHYGLEKWAKSTNFGGLQVGSTEPVPLLLGLDVEWPTPMSAESFSMYAKMGYMRWWQPCGSVGYVDWANLSRTGHSKYLHSAMTSPEELRKEIQDAKEAPSRYSKSHFCMFRYHSDSWLSIGKYLRDSLEQYPWPPQTDDADINSEVTVKK